MSETHSGEQDELIVVFHIFLFIAFAGFATQIGQKLGLKLPLLLLYLLGMVVGFHYIRFPHERIIVLEYLGRNVLRTAYTPVYFFTGIFDLESEFVHVQVLPHIVACIFIWMTTTASIVFVTTALYDTSLEWYSCILMAIITTIPDLKTTKHFMEVSNSFSNKKIFILLELECLIGSILASVAHDLYMQDFNHGSTSALQLLAFLVKNVFTCIFAFIVGKFTTASISRMHFDHTNQITAIFAAIFFTYAVAAGIESSGDLAVLTFGLVLLSAKPGMTPETVVNINRFIQTVRHALVGSVLAIGGVLFTISVYTSHTKKFISLNLVIYFIVISSRFVIIGGFSAIFRNSYNLTTLAVLIVCTFNIKGTFNIILALSLISDIHNFAPEVNQLFIFTNFQIFLSIVATTPIASFMFRTEGQKNVNPHTVEMVQKALARINECIEMNIKVLKGIQFTVDADWTKVVHATSIEKGFFRRFAYKVTLKETDSSPDVMSVSEKRAESVRDLLRLQKRFLEEQFRHGILTGPSAKLFAYLLRTCMHKATFMSSELVIDGTGPYSVMQIVVRDLMGALNNRRRGKCRLALFTFCFLFDLTLNIFASFSKIFMYSHINQYVPPLHMGYNLVMFGLGLVSVLQTGNYYFHTVSYSLWNWLAWSFTFLSLATFCVDMFVLEIEFNTGYSYRLGVESMGINMRVYYFLTMLTTVMVLNRSLLLACSLYPVQNLMFHIVSSMLQNSIFNQCDMCQGFLHAMIDTHQRLENRLLDKNMEAGAADVLHQQSLAMRQFIGVMEILSPDVMTAIRTRQACRLVLMSQEKIIHDLDENGELESKELGRLTDMLRTKLRAVHTLPTTMKEPSYIDIIRSIPWVARTKLNPDDVLDLGNMCTFKPGETIMEQGQKVEGLTIILKGLVRVEIVTKTDQMNVRTAFGYRKSRYTMSKRNTVNESTMEIVELSDFYTRGNVIGEFSFLIDKQGHKTYRCVTLVKALYLSRAMISALMGHTFHPHRPMNRLDHNIWITVAIRQAARFVQWSASYHLLTRHQLYCMLEDSFLVDSNQFGDLEKEDLKRAVFILIYGELSCPVIGGSYVGPAIIPSSLILLNQQRSGSGIFNEGANSCVILVLRAFQSMQMSTSLKPVKETQALDLDSVSTLSRLTLSSGSSDGIPYRHK